MRRHRRRGGVGEGGSGRREQTWPEGQPIRVTESNGPWTVSLLRPQYSPPHHSPLRLAGAARGGAADDARCNPVQPVATQYNGLHSAQRDATQHSPLRPAGAARGGAADDARPARRLAADDRAHGGERSAHGRRACKARHGPMGAKARRRTGPVQPGVARCMRTQRWPMVASPCGSLCALGHVGPGLRSPAFVGGSPFPFVRVCSKGGSVACLFVCGPAEHELVTVRRHEVPRASPYSEWPLGTAAV
jgi:hypothetical protein